MCYHYLQVAQDGKESEQKGEIYIKINVNITRLQFWLFF